MAHDHFMPDEVKEKLQHLIGKVSQYAVDKIKKELVKVGKEDNTDAPIKPNEGDSQSLACNCKIRVNFGIPCYHILPTTVPIPLSLLHPRWHLSLHNSPGSFLSRVFSVLHIDMKKKRPPGFK